MSDKCIPGFNSRNLLLFLLIVVLSFVCFFPTLQNGLLQWDDSGYIIENEKIRTLNLEMISWALSTFYVNYWAPLTWISLAADYAFWGLNPVGYHLTNNVLHSLNAGLFFLLLMSLFGSYIDLSARESSKSSYISCSSMHYTALLAALFFSLHPLRVQSVAWAAERKDVLSVFFGLLAMLSYSRYVRQFKDDHNQIYSPADFIRYRQYWLTLVFFCLSLLSKSMLVLFPVLLLVFDWFPFRRFRLYSVGGILLEKIPLLFFAGIASLLTVRSQGESLMSFAQTNLISRFLLACKSVVLYLWMTIWPFEISPFYVHRGRSFTSIGAEQLLPVAICIVISLFCLVTVRKFPIFSFVWLTYLITLFPVLGFTQTGPEGMAARFTYVPGMSLALLLSLGVTALVLKFGSTNVPSMITIFLVCCLLLVYGAVTRRDIGHWKNDIALWNRVIELEPHKTGRAYFERGYAYFLAGIYDKALVDTDEALRIAISKNYNRLFELHLQKARIYTQMGHFEEAISAYTEAINLDSSPSRNMYFAERGAIYEKMRRHDLAEEDFRQAGILSP